MKISNLSHLLLSLIIIISLAEFPLKTFAEMKQNQFQPTTPTQPQKQRSTWQAILTILKGRRETTGGSRGEVCLISPGLLEEKNIIWSDQPLFLWQVNNFPLEIRLYSPFNPQQEQEVIWRQDVNEIQGIQYIGQPLEPGKIYDWEIFNLVSKSRQRRSFQVMDIEERNLISQELKNLESQLIIEQATEEEIALEKAKYFAQLNLWSDMLQTISSVQHPSSELTKIRQEIFTYLCETINTNTEKIQN